MNERWSAQQKSTAVFFRYPDVALPTVSALAYSLVAYVMGLFLLSNLNAWFIVGVLLLAHSMVVAAFLLHECTHGTLFAQQSPGGVERHELLALLLSWLSGCCYCDFAALRDKHLRHHFERADIVALDYRCVLRGRPLLRRAITAGQWLCLPAVELLFHSWAIWRPLVHGDARQRRRVVAALLLRLLFFGSLVALLGWKVLPGYALAYGVFMTVMGFMDAFQHQYLLMTGLEQPRAQSPTLDRKRFPPGYFSRDYEQHHTFSNLLSRRWSWLNLLVLNFCYHNAHHLRPTEPWWRLPGWHQQLSESSSPPVEIPFAQQLRLFFNGRVARVMAPATDELTLGLAPGAAGVSFLTPL